jgi:hypothetical protein
MNKVFFMFLFASILATSLCAQETPVKRYVLNQDGTYSEQLAIGTTSPDCSQGCKVIVMIYESAGSKTLNPWVPYNQGNCVVLDTRYIKNPLTGVSELFKRCENKREAEDKLWDKRHDQHDD